MTTFSIMHGLGNRFAIFDGFRARDEIEQIDFTVLTPELCRTEQTIGLDGVIVIDADLHDTAPVRMRIWNADGSDGVMCGNGLRCVGKLVRERGYVDTDVFDVRTGGGIVVVRTDWDGKNVLSIGVEMGIPKFGLDEIPALSKRLSVVRTLDQSASVVEVGGVEGLLVNTGNPHFVARARHGSRDLDLDKLGPELVHHEAFPQRINVQLMQVLERDRVMLRTWERGAGITQACATGACASVIAGVLLGDVDRRARVHMPGGELLVHWHESSSLIEQSGAAVMEQENVPLPNDIVAVKTV